MGEKTEIAWCDSTFNPWIGCQKVSAGCDNCYAETLMDKRYHKVEWGPHGERKRTSEENWKLPLRWARKAREAVEDFNEGMLTRRPHRPRVFCASLADVFDNQVPEQWRADLFRLIGETPELDWLLLTKRPENISRMMARCWGIEEDPIPNLWLGTTCEDQAAYDRRWPILQDIPARVRFISYEPAIGPLDMIDYREKPDWLICGGESGRGFRSMQDRWAYDIMDQCELFNVPFFMKQLAGKAPIPHDLMIRQFPPGSN
jgi:protein gp37